MNKAPLITCVYVVFIPILRYSLKLLGYRKTIVLLKKVSPKRLIVPEPNAAVSKYKFIRKATHNHHKKATCLHNSIFLWWALRWANVDSIIKTGLKRQEKSKNIYLHAWVECDSTPINESLAAARSYIRLDI